MNLKSILASASALGCGAVLLAATPLDTRSMLRDLTDLGGLAEFPNPPYTCKQFSSYDPASKSPTEDWFANGDAGHFLRIEEVAGRKEHVMMDAAGPGAIVRIWSANPEGVLRIYVDGHATPVIAAPMKELLGGSVPALPRPIAGEYSAGWNLYLPIPYAKSCKVTSDKGGFYYHVNYRTYPAGTAVTSFDAAQLTALTPELKSLAEMLAAPAGLNPKPWAATGRAPTQLFRFALAPGVTGNLAELEGPKAIRHLRIKWKPTDDRDEAALRSVILMMTFDGETTVEVPLGDFFGAAPGLNPYESLPFSVSADGTLESRWVMPFQKSARVQARNLGKQLVNVEGEVSFAPYTWTDRSLYFHAVWRIEHDVSTEPKIDWNYLTATGRGVFAGVAFAIDNPVRAWWGEGDEKIYVDGEKFPSHFGTGTEDYFGYAWCSPALFTHAYHNQPRCDGPGNFGRTSVNRFHIIDRIPFEKDFRFDMELWHWQKCLVNLAVTSYWYARPGGTDAFPAIRAEDVVLRPTPERKISRVAGAIEGETMRIIEKTGIAAPQEWEGTSGEAHLWWHRDQQPGDTLTLGFAVSEAGTYRVRGRFLKAIDYGIAQFAINGVKAGAPIDFYHDGVVITEEIDLGSFALKAGENRLSMTVVGANPKAVKSYMVGLDYLKLEPVR